MIRIDAVCFVLGLVPNCDLVFHIVKAFLLEFQVLTLEAVVRNRLISIILSGFFCLFACFFLYFSFESSSSVVFKLCSDPYEGRI